MKIEAGKYYKTTEGDKVGPAAVNLCEAYPWNIPHGGNFYAYTPKGKSCLYQHQEDNIVSEWVEEETEEMATGMVYKTWGKMAPEEKGALLLAHHEGKVIECTFEGAQGWCIVWEPSFNENFSYRVKPEEPKVEEEVFDGVHLNVYDVPYTYGMQMSDTTKGTATVTYTDGKPTKMVWESTE